MHQQNQSIVRGRHQMACKPLLQAIDLWADVVLEAVSCKFICSFLVRTKAGDPAPGQCFFLLNTPETLLLFGGNRERWANRIIWRTLSRLSTSRKAWHHWTNYIHIWISLISGSGSSLVIEPASWVPPNKSRVSGAFLQASATNEIVLSKNVKC